MVGRNSGKVAKIEWKFIVFHGKIYSSRNRWIQMPHLIIPPLNLHPLLFPFRWHSLEIHSSSLRVCLYLWIWVREILTCMPQDWLIYAPTRDTIVGQYVPVGNHMQLTENYCLQLIINRSTHFILYLVHVVDQKRYTVSRMSVRAKLKTIKWV